MTRRCPACGSEGDILIEATAILRLPATARYDDLQLEVVSMIEFNDDAAAGCPAENCGHSGPLKEWTS